MVVKNPYITNACLGKQPFVSGCLGIQVAIDIVFCGRIMFREGSINVMEIKTEQMTTAVSLKYQMCWDLIGTQ